MKKDKEEFNPAKPISILSLVSGELKDKYRCFYCGDVPVDVVNDWNCLQSFCGECLKNEAPAKCPVESCGNALNSNHPNKPGKDKQIKVYHSLEFQCSYCDTRYKYNDHKKHHDECGIETRCILNCGEEKTFRNKLELLHHLSQSCAKSELVCNKCQIKMPVEQAIGHPHDGSCVSETPSVSTHEIDKQRIQEKKLEELLEKANNQLKDIRALMKKKVKETEELNQENQKYKREIEDLREKLNQQKTESPQVTSSDQLLRWQIERILQVLSFTYEDQNQKEPKNDLTEKAIQKLQGVFKATSQGCTEYLDSIDKQNKVIGLTEELKTTLARVAGDKDTADALNNQGFNLKKKQEDTEITIQKAHEKKISDSNAGIQLGNHLERSMQTFTNVVNQDPSKVNREQQVRCNAEKDQNEPVPQNALMRSPQSQVTKTQINFGFSGILEANQSQMHILTIEKLAQLSHSDKERSMFPKETSVDNPIEAFIYDGGKFKFLRRSDLESDYKYESNSYIHRKKVDELRIYENDEEEVIAIAAVKKGIYYIIGQNNETVSKKDEDHDFTCYRLRENDRIIACEWDKKTEFKNLRLNIHVMK